MTAADIVKALGETLGRTLISTFLAYVIGLPLGVLLRVSGKDGIRPNRPLNLILGLLVNFLRSVPCLILTVILIPLNRAIVGYGSGRWYAMIIPLVFSTFAYVARIVEQSLSEVDPGEIEAVRSLGGNNWQIISKVLLPEARPSLLRGLAVTLVNVIGYTSFAYNIGAGGLIADIWSFYTRHTGDFLVQARFWVRIILVVVFVQVVQELGLFLARKFDKRRKTK